MSRHTVCCVITVPYLYCKTTPFLLPNDVSIFHVSFFSLPGCLLTLLIAVLNVRELIIVYFYLISVSMLYFSYQQNTKFAWYMITLDTEESESDDLFVYNILWIIGIQCIIGFLYGYLNPTKYKWLSKTVLVSFLIPPLLCLLPLPAWILENVPFYTALLPVAISKYIFCSNIPAITQHIFQGWRFCRNFVM